MVEPVDQVLPEPADDVNVTDPPEQNVVAPPAVIVGAEGDGFNVMVVPADEAEVQPEAVAVTVYVPALETVIDGVVAPFDQVFPEPADDVNVTEPPEQNVVAPPAAIVGVAGIGFTVTVTPAEAGDVHPLTVLVTVYVPEVVAVIDGVIAPVDQVFPEPAEDVRVTEPPVQNVVAPPAVIVGADGVAFTVSVAPLEFALPHELVPTHRY